MFPVPVKTLPSSVVADQFLTFIQSNYYTGTGTFCLSSISRTKAYIIYNSLLIFLFYAQIYETVFFVRRKFHADSVLSSYIAQAKRAAPQLQHKRHQFENATITECLITK